MMDALEPYILEILGIIITAAIAFAAAQLKRWTGIVAARNIAIDERITAVAAGRDSVRCTAA